jgi:hypothetical protein
VSPVRAPKRLRATAHSKAVRLRLLPSYVEPEKDESLLSWTLRLAANLGVSTNVFARRILGIDSKLSDSLWWAYPSPWVVARLAAKTELSPAQLKHMTFADWAPKVRDDDARERFSGIQIHTRGPARRRDTRLAVCVQCLDASRTPYLPLSWMLGWLAVCPIHATVMVVRCPHCKRRLQLPSFNHHAVFNPAACLHCHVPLAAAPLLAHSSCIELQARLLHGKRFCRTALPGIGELTWPQIVAFLDLLLSLFWTGTSFDERWGFANEFVDDFPPIGAAEMSPHHSRYGGLCMLSWLLNDWDLDRARGANVARLLLSRWLAGSQPQASRFAGIEAPVAGPAGGPYPFRPRQHANPWAGRVSGVPTAADAAPPAAAPSPTNPLKPASSGDAAGAGRSIPFTGRVIEPTISADATPMQQPDPTEAIQEQLDLLASEEELKRRQGLAELERLRHSHRHGVRRHIPL